MKIYFAFVGGSEMIQCTQCFEWNHFRCLEKQITKSLRNPIASSSAVSVINSVQDRRKVSMLLKLLAYPTKSEQDTKPLFL